MPDVKFGRDIAKKSTEGIGEYWHYLGDMGVSTWPKPPSSEGQPRIGQFVIIAVLPQLQENELSRNSFASRPRFPA
jgi:hypothetical protein